MIDKKIFKKQYGIDNGDVHYIFGTKEAFKKVMNDLSEQFPNSTLVPIEDEKQQALLFSKGAFSSTSAMLCSTC